MAKKKGAQKKSTKAKKNNSQNNQLVYYILFFVLGAIFAAGILAVNDGISGKATYPIEDSAFDEDVNELFNIVGDYQVQRAIAQSPEEALLQGQEALMRAEMLQEDYSRFVVASLIREDLERDLQGREDKRMITEQVAGMYGYDPIMTDEWIEFGINEEGKWVPTRIRAGEIGFSETDAESETRRWVEVKAISEEKEEFHLTQEFITEYLDSRGIPHKIVAAEGYDEGYASVGADEGGMEFSADSGYDEGILASADSGYDEGPIA